MVRVAVRKGGKVMFETVEDVDVFDLTVGVWKYAGKPITREDLDILFQAEDIPPGGYRLYLLKDGVGMLGQHSERSDS